MTPEEEYKRYQAELRAARREEQLANIRRGGLAQIRNLILVYLVAFAVVGGLLLWWLS